MYTTPHKFSYVIFLFEATLSEPVWPSGKALQVGSAGRTSVRYRFGSPFFSKRLWFVDTVLWLCPSLPTETLKWLLSLPILMQESFCWWQCSDRYIISSPPPPPFSPSLISLMVSVDVKHCLLTKPHWYGLGVCVFSRCNCNYRDLLPALLVLRMLVPRDLPETAAAVSTGATSVYGTTMRKFTMSFYSKPHTAQV